LVRISATFLRTMMVELPESAAHVATDPNRVYYVGAGGNPCRLPGLLSFHLTRPCLRLCPSLRSAHNMLDGLRQGLVSYWAGSAVTARTGPPRIGESLLVGRSRTLRWCGPCSTAAARVDTTVRLMNASCASIFGSCCRLLG